MNLGTARILLAKRKTARITRNKAGMLRQKEDRRRLGAASLLLLMLLVRYTQAQQVKLIHYGWDNQYITNLPGDVMNKLKNSVFDGISVYSTEYSAVFLATTYSSDIHNWDKEVLDTQLNKSLLKDSYIIVHGMTDNKFDWTNDIHWANTLNNMRMLVNLTKHGAFKGIVFDMEPYGKNPWDYGTQPAAPSRTFEEMQAIVRNRGRSMMESMQAEYPGLTIWCLYGLSANLFDLESLEWIEGGPQAVLKQSGYGLWVSFFNGWLDGKAQSTTLIDGNEPAYYFTRRRQFVDQKDRIRYDVSIFLDEDSRQSYPSKITVGHAVYVDAVMNTWRNPRFIGYYIPADRSKLLYSNVLNALNTSESLVWVYSEVRRYWDVPAPSRNIDQTLRRGKRDALVLKLPPPSPWPALIRAERAVANVVEIGGTFTDASGRGYVPDRWGNETATAGCAHWGDRGEYSCAYPRGSRRVTIRPTIRGKKVIPAYRTFAKIDDSNWGVNWRVVPA
jgi:hypothetical protein